MLEKPGATAAGAFRRLAEIDLADPAPPPFIRFWLYGHPPIGERIACAERADAGGTGSGGRIADGVRHESTVAVGATFV